MRIESFIKMLALAAAGILLSVAAARAQSEAENMRLFMDGARLWPVYCSQCHNARPSSEFSPQQWNTIMMHMRTQSCNTCGVVTDRTCASKRSASANRPKGDVGRDESVCLTVGRHLRSDNARYDRGAASSCARYKDYVHGL